jgi:hypothetical protein
MHYRFAFTLDQLSKLLPLVVSSCWGRGLSRHHARYNAGDMRQLNSPVKLDVSAASASCPLRAAKRNGPNRAEGWGLWLDRLGTGPGGMNQHHRVNEQIPAWFHRGLFRICEWPKKRPQLRGELGP